MRLFGLALAAAAALLAPPVDCDVASEMLAAVHEHMARLDRDLAAEMSKVFYDHRTLAQAEENYILLYLSAQMAESEAAMYAMQKRALLAAEIIIKEYFVAKTQPLGPLLIRGKSLIELIVKRSLVSSIDRGLTMIERHRKEIFLLQLKFEFTQRGVMDLTRAYVRLRAANEAQYNAERHELGDALNRYRDVAQLRLADATAAHAEVDVVGTMGLIDQMLRMAELAADGHAALDLDAVLDKYAGPYLARDIKYSRFLAGQVDKPSASIIDAVSMHKVLTYERKIVEETTALDTYLRQIDLRANETEQRFRRNLREIFYDVYNEARLNENYPRQALSAQMAEIEAFLYAGEMRMLALIKRMFIEHISDFANIIATNSRPVRMLVLRLVARGAANGFNVVELRRKKVYQTARRYKRYYGVKDLSTRFARHMNASQTALVDTVSEIRQLVSVYRDEVPEAQANSVLVTIDRLAEAEATKWLFGSDEYYLLRNHLDARTFEDIRQACQKSSNKVYRPRGDLYNSISMDEILQYDNLLLLDAQSG